MTAGVVGDQQYERARSQFPVFDKALGHMAFMENAGGSQVGIVAIIVSAMHGPLFHDTVLMLYRFQLVLQMQCEITCFSIRLSLGLDTSCPSDLLQSWTRLMRLSR